jgi:hypothetical protein
MLRHIYFWVQTLFKQHWRLSYDGEFSYELISVLPFAHWLHKKGKKVSVCSSKDTKCLYYFADNHIEQFKERRSCRATGVPIHNIHVRWLNTSLWSPPPLKEIYKNNRFVYKKPLMVITNKYNSEWGHPPLTFLSIEFLETLFKELVDKYQIVYCRPSKKEIVDDNSDILTFNDKEIIKNKFPQVLLIEDLHIENPDLTFNELQLMVFANTNRFISLLGGYSLLCSYFKGTNIIYAAKSKIRQGTEIGYKAFDRWYHKFSGSNIIYCDSYDKILTALKTSVKSSVET